MIRLIIIFCVYVVCLPAAFSQQGKDQKHQKDVNQLPAVIYDVKGMGQWKKGSDAGQLRLVIARTNKRDEVYLQWVKWNSHGPEKVVNTVMIKEIQESANYKTTFIRRETFEGKRQIVLGLENLHDKSSNRAILEVTGVGRYYCKI
jgi:hypothetical protein